MKTIYILGLGHCGSTILSRWLSQLEGAVAVGEAQRYMEGKRRTNQGTETCSCGEHCPIWSRNPTSMEELQDILSQKGYTLMIDSSKKYQKVHGEYVIYIKRPLVKTIWRKMLWWNTHSLKKRLFSLKGVIGRHHRNEKIAKHAKIITLKEFRKNPERILREVSEWTGHPIDWKEKSHIALSSRSKYKPLKIV